MQRINILTNISYQSVAHSIRDRLLERWNATQVYVSRNDPKRVYYLSLEFLLGRSLDNAMLNMGIIASNYKRRKG